MKYTVCRRSRNYFWKTDYSQLRDRFLAMPSLLFLTQQTTFLLLPAFINSLKARETAYLESSLWFTLARFSKLGGLMPRANSSAWHVGSRGWVSLWWAGPQQGSAWCTMSVSCAINSIISPLEHGQELPQEQMGKPLESHLMRACFLTRCCSNNSSIHEVLFLDCCPSMQLWHSPSANLHSNKTFSLPCPQQANTKMLWKKEIKIHSPPAAGNSITQSFSETHQAPAYGWLIFLSPQL